MISMMRVSLSLQNPYLGAYFRPAARSVSTSIGLIKTALNDLHKELGGDMVPFAGYELPVLYKGENGGVMKEHLWCRSDGKASLFDVSHMGQVSQMCQFQGLIARLTSIGSKSQIRWYGKDRVAFLERIVVGDIAGLKENHACLSLVTNEQGGILDDTVITNAGDHIYMVVNGATKFDDMNHFEQQMELFGGDVTMDYHGNDIQLFAVQGPGSAAAVSKLLPSNFELSKLEFMTGADVTLDGIEGCRITR